MTLLDTEQSYVESLRTLMQVRLPDGPAPQSGHSESRRLSDMREQTCFMGRSPGQRGERDDPGTHHPSGESPHVTAPEEEASSMAGENTKGP